jgi:hypothetical protein
LGNALVGQFAKAGVHTVYGGTALGSFVDQCGTGTDAVACRIIQRDQGGGVMELAQLCQR